MNFTELVSRWQRIKAGEEQFLDGPPDLQAKRFYSQHLLPEIIKNARRRWAEEGPKDSQFDLLISMSGFSPETTIIAYSVLRPRNLLVISSPKADAGIDQIADQVVGSGEGRLPQRRFHHKLCNPTDPYEIYRKVKECLDENKIGAASNERIRAIIDMTGGKKVMSAAAGLLAWRLNLPLCYVESDFDESSRRPRPGSERLIFLENPLSIYREDEKSQALAAFNSGNYHVASRQFRQLAEAVCEPAFAKFMTCLSEFYRAWSDLDFELLPAVTEALETALASPFVRAEITQDQSDCLHHQLHLVQSIANVGNPEGRRALLKSFYLLGCHYMERLQRHDFAALLFYRSLEGCLQMRLEDRFPGFTCSRPDYGVIEPDLLVLLQKFNRVACAVGPEHAEERLPKWLGFLNSAALLMAVEDDLIRRAHIAIPGGLNELKAVSAIRNGSVLAHGTSTVDERKAGKLKAMTERVLNAYLSLTCEDAPEGSRTLPQLVAPLRFLEMRPA